MAKKKAAAADAPAETKKAAKTGTGKIDRQALLKLGTE